MLTFRLARAGRVVVTITQVFPSCELAGKFVVSGHAGLNRVAFRGRVQGHALPAGTYRIRTSAAPNHHLTLVILDHMPSPAELAVARTRNSCQSSLQLAAAQIFPSATGPGLAPASSPASDRGYGALGSSASRASVHHASFAPFGLDSGRAFTNPVVIAALAAAMLLLGLAALPERAIIDPGLGQLLIRHRVDLAAFGIAALAIGVVAMILG